MYERGLPADWRLQPVGAAAGMAMHESQSLLVEMQACRGAAFVTYMAPLAREAFGGEGPAWDADNLLALTTRVEPGFIRTAAMELLADEEGLKQMTKYIPAGYMGDPEDIAYCMLYLASDETRYLTGQTICIDGGSTLPESPVFLEELEGIKELAGSS